MDVEAREYFESVKLLIFIFISSEHYGMSSIR